MCSCATYSDKSTNNSMCSQHATQDPCLTVSLVTGRRRKGSIKSTGCTNCGWNN